MTEHSMETIVRTALWRQFGAAIEMLENALMRQQCQSTITELSDEQAHQQVDYPWTRGKPTSYFELLVYTLRHVQEHAAQLSLFLGQHGIPGEALDWVPRAKGEAGG